MRGGKGDEPRGGGAAGAGSAEEGTGSGRLLHIRPGDQRDQGELIPISDSPSPSQDAVEMEAKLDQLRSLVEAADRDKVELLNQLEEEKRWAVGPFQQLL